MTKLSVERYFLTDMNNTRTFLENLPQPWVVCLQRPRQTETNRARLSGLPSPLGRAVHVEPAKLFRDLQRLQHLTTDGGDREDRQTNVFTAVLLPSIVGCFLQRARTFGVCHSSNSFKRVSYCLSYKRQAHGISDPGREPSSEGAPCCLCYLRVRFKTGAELGRPSTLPLIGRRVPYTTAFQALQLHLYYS